MKSFIKYVKGGLKMALISLPALLLAGVAGLIADGSIKANNVCDEVRNTQLVQELIEQEQANLDVTFEESGMSLEEWTSRKEYLESNEFISDIMDRYPELKEYKDRYHNAVDVEAPCSLIFSVPAAAGFLSCIAFYTKIMKDYSEPASYEELIASAKNDFEEAKEIKKSEKLNKELHEYTEEIL